MNIRYDVIEAVSSNPFFKRNNISEDLELEWKIINSLKIHAKYNNKAFDIIKPEWFSNEFYKNEYIKLLEINNKGNELMAEFKDMIYKLNRYWVCRRCKELGMKEYDWKTIIVEYVQYLPKDEYNDLRKWDNEFSEILCYKQHQFCKIIGCQTMKHYYNSIHCVVCPKQILKDIKDIDDKKEIKEDNWEY